MASVAVKAQQHEKKRGRRPSQRIADGISMLSELMEHAGLGESQSSISATDHD